MNLNTRYSRKGVSEITSTNDNTYLKFATKNRVGYIVLDDSTGKFSITPGVEGLEPGITVVNASEVQGLDSNHRWFTDAIMNTITAQGQMIEMLEARLNEAGIVSSIYFTTTGASFAPVIEIEGEAEVLWTFSDETTSSSLEPSVSFGSADTRIQTLTVTPWSAVRAINLGYGRDDGGSSEIPIVPAQGVSMVSGLKVVAPYLEVWCSSRNPLTSLDFSNFTALHTVECFQCTNLASINVMGATSLTRLCVESNRLTNLNLSTNSLLGDLRTSDNYITEVVWGDTGTHLWHYCAGDSRGQLVPPLVTNKPALEDAWLWNNAATGEFRPNSKVLRSVWIHRNNYTYVDVSNCPNLYEITAQDNPNLSYIDITGNYALTRVTAQNCALTLNAVNHIVTVLAAGTGTNGTLNLAGSAAPTNTAGIATLIGRGWTVTVEEDTNAFHTITASAGSNGSISPSGEVSVAVGTNRTFTFTPSAGYAVASVTVDSTPVAVANSYTFTNVTADHTIAVTFSAMPQAPAAPTCSPVSGTYETEQTVTISCATPGATIYYTTDNSTPTTSSTRYTGPITVSSSLNIRSVAYLGGVASSVSMCFYTIAASPASNTITIIGDATDVIAMRLGTITPGTTVSVDWGDGSAIDVINVGVESSATSYTAYRHFYDHEDNWVVTVTLSPNLTYFGLSNGFGYSGDLSGLSYCTALTTIFIFQNSFTFDPSSWSSLTNLIGVYTAQNPFTTEQSSALAIALDTAGNSNGTVVLPHGRGSLTTAGAAAWTSLQSKGWNVSTE